MEISKALQMTIEAPAKKIRMASGAHPSISFTKGRINDPIKMMCPRVRGSIFDKAIIIAFQQRDVPFDMSAKIRIILGAMLSLLPRIKYLDRELSATFGH